MSKNKVKYETRELEYILTPLALIDSQKVSSEYSSHAELLYNLNFSKQVLPGEYSQIGYTPNVMFPFCIWWKQHDDEYWSCYHIMVSFQNNSQLNFDLLAKMVNHKNTGILYFLGQVKKELETKQTQEGQLEHDESMLHTAIEEYLTHAPAGTSIHLFKVLPLVMNMERYDVFTRKMGRLRDEVKESMTFNLDRRLTLTDTKYSPAQSMSKPRILTADLYSFAVEYGVDKSTWFYNLFWDDNYGQDTLENQDVLLNDRTGTKWEEFCTYNELVPHYVLDMANQKDGKVVGVFPVYINTAVIVDAKVLGSYAAGL